MTSDGWACTGRSRDSLGSTASRWPTGGFGKLFHTHDPASYYLKGVSWSTWGENVGVTGGSVADLQEAFMNSSPHRANIMNERFRRVALGTYRDDDGLLWVTVFFYG